MTSPTALERIEALAAGKPKEEKLGNLNKDGKPKVGYGGARKGGGRPKKIETLVKQGVQEILEGHVNEVITVEMEIDGKKLVIKKPRSLIVLEKLYEIGSGGKGNSDALKAWLDRALGKPLQPVQHQGDPDKPLHISIDY